MQMNKNQYNVIVFGRSGYNTLGVMRSFHQYGITPFLLIVKSVQLRSTICSNTVKEYKIVDSEEQGVQFLLERQGFVCGKTVIIPTSDKVESELDKAFDVLKEHYIFPNAKIAGRVSHFMNKDVTTAIAAKYGIKVPQTYCISSVNEIPSTLLFPCLIKPQKSIDGSKSEIRICDTKEELIRSIDTSLKHKFLVQEYIQKDFDILLNGCRLLSNGETILQGIFKKFRWSSNGGDGSWGVITSDIEKYIDRNNVESFLRELDYYGPFSMEFGVKDNVPYFFEINLRNDGTSHYFNLLGCHIAVYWSMDALARIMGIKPLENKIEYSFISEFDDFINIFTSNLTLKKWFSDLKNAKIYKYYDRHDNFPFFRFAPRRIVKSFYTILTSKH